MGRTGDRDDLVVRDPKVPGLHQDLKAGLGVQLRAVLPGGVRTAEKQAAHHALRLRDAAVQTDGSDQGLQGVLAEGGRKIPIPHGPAAEQDLCDAQGLGPAAERGPTNQRRAHLRELALGRVRVPLEQDARDEEAQDGVPQKLQALVAERYTVFVGER